jgi:hypothetical protein
MNFISIDSPSSDLSISQDMSGYPISSRPTIRNGLTFQYYNKVTLGGSRRIVRADFFVLSSFVSEKCRVRREKNG